MEGVRLGMKGFRLSHRDNEDSHILLQRGSKFRELALSYAGQVLS